MRNSYKYYSPVISGSVETSVESLYSLESSETAPVEHEENVKRIDYKSEQELRCIPSDLVLKI